MCNQSTWSTGNLWNCIRRTYLTIKNHQRKFYKILTSWRIQDTKTKLDDKKQCFYIPVKFLVTHEYKKPKRWHTNMYMISQKNYNHLFATKHMWKAEKIKKITYPRKGMCVCKHLFITCPAVFSKIELHCAISRGIKEAINVWTTEVPLYLLQSSPGRTCTAIRKRQPGLYWCWVLAKCIFMVDGDILSI